MSSEAQETVYEALCAKLLKSSKQRESCIYLCISYIVESLYYVVELLAKRQLY